MEVNTGDRYVYIFKPIKNYIIGQRIELNDLKNNFSNEEIVELEKNGVITIKINK